MRLLSFLFSFEGRIGRRTYWLYFVLPLLVIFLVVAVAVPPLSFNRTFVVLFLLTSWPALAVGAKRCHDRNRSGWYQLIGLIPVIGPFVLMKERSARLSVAAWPNKHPSFIHEPRLPSTPWNERGWLCRHLDHYGKSGRS
ncbi:DUF805 domain-containing protein [Bradyrhizobium icense]|uniref:DUF805 domain-containing protein n=1 Tax=Bradyrhizobium icense TaxID=1274631 RepID=UPI0009F2A095